MKFMGSKARIAKHIIPIMESYRDGRPWVEPFVGGGNSIDKIGGEAFGFDNNPDVISALSSIRDSVSELPKNNKEFSERDYKIAKKNLDYPHRSYIGFSCSYGGKWFGGWCRDSLNKRDYVNESYRNSLAQSTRLQNIELCCSEYYSLSLPNSSLIYCDPPYKGTTGYHNTFDSDFFWNWCRGMHKAGHTVFVSEYEAPNDFECVWKKGLASSLTKDTGSKKAVECLFKIKSDA